MVLIFKSTTCEPPAMIYMGKDKFENEELLKYVFEDDVWFHVDNMSSAHVYLRTHGLYKIEEIPAALLVDCCQLVKANSIEGNKKDNIKVSYTYRRNLTKSKGMDVGTVMFKAKKQVKTAGVEKRENSIVNRLNKTRTEITMEAFVLEIRDITRQDAHEKISEEKRNKEENLAQKKLLKSEETGKSYDKCFKETEMKTNAEIASRYADEQGEVDVDAFEDDFM